MKKNNLTSIASFLFVISSCFLFSCNDKEVISDNKDQEKGFVYPTRIMHFHLQDEVKDVIKENNEFSPVDVAYPHHRFLGWSTSTSKDDIIFTNNDPITFKSVKDYYAYQDEMDLYAIYADVISVNFMVDDIPSIELDSELNNLEEIPPFYFDESISFRGWSLNEDLSSIDVNKDVQCLDYIDISKISDELEVNLYPVFYDTHVKFFKYDTSETISEIHINTENGIAIDDPSLIKEDEVKGRDGEIPVYDYVKAKIDVNHCDEKYELNEIDAKVKVRGNYTSTYAKKPIRIKFDKKQTMLGLNDDNKFKNWVLLACWKDTSFLRDAAAFYLGNGFLKKDGYYSSTFRLVNVYINEEYNGVYLLVEQQEINDDRVTLPISKNEVETGYFLELDGYYHNEKDNQKFVVNYNDVWINNRIGFTISNDINTIEQYNFIKNTVQHTWNVVYDALRNDHSDLSLSPYHTVKNGEYVKDETISNSYDAIDKVIDIRSLVDIYLLHEMLEDRDIGFSSFYFSYDNSETGNKKLTFTAPWDFDYASGNNTFQNALTATLDRQKLIKEGRMTNNGKHLMDDTILFKNDFTFNNKDALYCEATDNPWFEIVSNESWLYEMLLNRYNDAKEIGLYSSLYKMVNQLSSKYKDDFIANFEKWPECLGIRLSSYQPQEIKYFVNERQAAEYLNIWLKERIEGLGIALNNRVNESR